MRLFLAIAGDTEVEGNMPASFPSDGQTRKIKPGHRDNYARARVESQTNDTEEKLPSVVQFALPNRGRIVIESKHKC